MDYTNNNYVVKNYYYDMVVIITFIKFSYIKSKMVANDMQQKSQKEYKDGLDEILELKDILAEARREHLMEIAEILPQAVAKYVFDGTIKRYFTVNRKSGEIDIYCGGNARSQSPIFRSRGEELYIGKYVYDFGGKVSIKDDKLKLELGRGRALNEEIYYDGKKEMNKYRYERQMNGLRYLRELSRMDEMLPLAILYLERKLHENDVGERKRIDMEYNVLTGELSIKVCGDNIMESPEDTYRNMLYAPIYYSRFDTERKCIELEGKKEGDEIILNAHYSIEYKPYSLKKEHIPEVLELEYTLSEKTLKQRYDLEEHMRKNK